jgi:hypothetical protein
MAQLQLGGSEKGKKYVGVEASEILAGAEEEQI